MRILFTILLCTIVLSGSAFAMANTADSTQREVAFVGGGWDKGPVAAGGFGGRVIGDLWVYTGTEFGVSNQAAILEFAYMLPISKLSTLGVPYLDRLSLSAVTGPDFNWENTLSNDGKPTISRILGCAGGIATFKLSEALNVWTFYKRRFALESNSFSDKNIFGAGISFRASVLSKIF